MSKIDGSSSNAQMFQISPKAGKMLDATIAPPKAAAVLGLRENTVISHRATAQTPAHSSGIGDRIKTAFQSFGSTVANLARSGLEALRGLARHEPATQVPAAPQQAAPPPPPVPLTSEALFGKWAKTDKGYELREESVKSSKLSPTDRDAGTYAYVKDAASKAALQPTTFMRGTSNGAILTSAAGNQPESFSIIRDLRQVFGDTHIMVSSEAFGFSRSVAKDATTQQEVTTNTYSPSLSSFPSMRDIDPKSAQYATAKADAIESSIQVIDDCMCHAFGTPGDQASIREAAAKLPQSLCNQIAILHKAIDDSVAPEGMDAQAFAALKTDFKAHAARDAVALRTIVPIGTNIVAGMDDPERRRVADENKTRAYNNQVSFRREVPAQSLMELCKAMQSLVNGVGFGVKTADPDAQSACNVKQERWGDLSLQDRWNDSFLDFMNAAVARADGAVVNAAVQNGASFTAPPRPTA